MQNQDKLHSMWMIFAGGVHTPITIMTCALSLQHLLATGVATKADKNANAQSGHNKRGKLLSEGHIVLRAFTGL